MSPYGLASSSSERLFGKRDGMLRIIVSTLKKLLSGGQGLRLRRRERAMRLCETLPLGDRRFLALVLVEGHKFLVGTAANSVSLVARIPPVGEGESAGSGAEPQPVFDPEEYKTWQ